MTNEVYSARAKKMYTVVQRIDITLQSALLLIQFNQFLLIELDMQIFHLQRAHSNRCR